ncbi:hypothetical protein CXB51_025342 [Gossypium anomalum]|uniref:Reverse transcriptase Ty1/copia-type domain-containing protein n=1 Tax=Gossypium anomalum TaxID=47600 RepID=A0A8J6CPR0_9ROSI|nr:hypothetical protein CXB51_025342 [Gossypium anomalum]
MHTGEVLLKGFEQHGLYKLHLPNSDVTHLSTVAHSLIATSTIPFDVWHCRLGHPCMDILIKALRTSNISFDGPAPVASNGFRYYVVFTDAYTRQIVETGLSMLAHASMPLIYWSDAFANGVYLLNRLPSRAINHATPYGKSFKTKPDYTFLRVFGCLCFPNLRPYNNYKLHFRSSPCTFLGYSPTHKGYQCLDTFGKVYVTRHVTFNETIFPFQNKLQPSKSVNQPQFSSKLLVLSPIYPSPTSHAHTSSQSPTASATSHNSSPTPPCSKAGIFKPKAYMSIGLSSPDDVPQDIHAAMRYDSQKTAMNDELQALIFMKKWSLRQIDINNGFLNGELAEDIYIEQPQGFEEAYSSLFIRGSPGNLLLLIVYVDDIVLTGNSVSEIDRVVQQLHARFALKDIGLLNFFLGISIARTSIGYLCVTRPDLAYCVNKLSQYINAPREIHCKAVKGALRYLCGTMHHGLFYPTGQCQLTGYSDADWASSVEDRRSTTGYVLYLGSNPIAWCSKK